MRRMKVRQRERERETTTTLSKMDNLTRVCVWGWSWKRRIPRLYSTCIFHSRTSRVEPPFSFYYFRERVRLPKISKERKEGSLKNRKGTKLNDGDREVLVSKREVRRSTGIPKQERKWSHVGYQRGRRTKSFSLRNGAEDRLLFPREERNKCNPFNQRNLSFLGSLSFDFDQKEGRRLHYFLWLCFFRTKPSL